uniref:Uncharacterized protein n=2 Tax=Neobodo designis TaxID=312471 RepID=A0A7S1W0A7_NEODS|mmetsp:Transcript_47779/g.147385  ORF Transcript_47779/g.147385 Transcript_47779/m.147385 type:complete len:119 (+) Transcript_47779:543-899(+)
MKATEAHVSKIEQPTKDVFMECMAPNCAKGSSLVHRVACAPALGCKASRRSPSSTRKLRDRRVNLPCHDQVRRAAREDDARDREVIDAATVRRRRTTDPARVWRRVFLEAKARNSPPP